MNYFRRLIQFSLNYCSRFVKYFFAFAFVLYAECSFDNSSINFSSSIFFSCAVAVTIFLIIMIIALIVHWICGNDNDNIKGNSTN